MQPEYIELSIKHLDSLLHEINELIESDRVSFADKMFLMETNLVVELEILNLYNKLDNSGQTFNPVSDEAKSVKAMRGNLIRREKEKRL